MGVGVMKSMIDNEGPGMGCFGKGQFGIKMIILNREI